MSQSEILETLRDIRDANAFDPAKVIATTLAASISFLIALSLNEALTKTFKLIPLGNGLGGLWIYALLALVLGILLLCLLNYAVQPALTKLFHKKSIREASSEDA
jgi:hypothetical protein